MLYNINYISLTSLLFSLLFSLALKPRIKAYFYKIKYKLLLLNKVYLEPSCISLL